MISEQNLKTYEWIWTTSADEFYLLRLEGTSQLAIVKIKQGPPLSAGTLIIEDNDIYAAVVQKMLDAGIQVINRDEFNRLRGR